MNTKQNSSINATDILREASEFGEKAAAAIDQLLAQRRATVDAAKVRITEFNGQIQRLNEFYHSSTGHYYVPPPQSAETALGIASANGEKTPRVRRPKEELQKTAAAVVEFLASKGASGASGTEIRALFPDVTASVKDFVQKHTGVSLRDNGKPKAAMRYLPPK